MKIYFLMLFLALMGIRSAVSFPKRSAAVPDCSYCEDGEKLPDINSCSRYYLCVGGESLQQRCARGLYFDALSGLCNRAFLVDCTLNRLGQRVKEVEGFLADKEFVLDEDNEESLLHITPPCTSEITTPCTPHPNQPQKPPSTPDNLSTPCTPKQPEATTACTAKPQEPTTSCTPKQPEATPACTAKPQEPTTSCSPKQSEATTPCTPKQPEATTSCTPKPQEPKIPCTPKQPEATTSCTPKPQEPKTPCTPKQPEATPPCTPKPQKPTTPCITTEKPCTRPRTKAPCTKTTPCTTTALPCTKTPPPCTKTPPCTTSAPCTTTAKGSENNKNLPYYRSSKDCLYLPEGQILLNRYHCRRHYVCTNKRAKPINCGFGECFNKDTLKCCPRSSI